MKKKAALVMLALALSAFGSLAAHANAPCADPVTVGPCDTTDANGNDVTCDYLYVNVVTDVSTVAGCIGG